MTIVKTTKISDTLARPFIFRIYVTTAAQSIVCKRN